MLIRFGISFVLSLLVAGCAGSSREEIKTAVSGAVDYFFNELDKKMEPPVVRPEVLPSVKVLEPESPPVRYVGDELQVGTDISPKQELPVVNGHPGVSYGRVNDGEGSVSVSEYLGAHASVGKYKSFDGLETFHEFPPTVHIPRGTSTQNKENILRAIQFINEALPPKWHLIVGDEVDPLSETVPDGQIYVDFAPWSDWADPNKPLQGRSRGSTQHFTHRIYYLSEEREPELDIEVSQLTIAQPEYIVVKRAAHVWIDPEEAARLIPGDSQLVKLVVHELIHALGFKAHVDRLDTIMPISGDIFWSNDKTAIYPVDREGLTAAYTHFKAGDPSAIVYWNLGGWDDTSTHLLGQNEYAEFGVANRNGFSQPWASERPLIHS